MVDRGACRQPVAPDASGVSSGDGPKIPRKGLRVQVVVYLPRGDTGFLPRVNPGVSALIFYEPPALKANRPPSKTRACGSRPGLAASTARPGPLVVGHPCPPWATVPELRPPAAVRPAKAPRADEGFTRPARVMRPAGGLSVPKAIVAGWVGHPALRAAASPPMSPWGGFGGREQIYGRRCAALVLVSQPPPRPPGPRGGAGGGRGATRALSPAPSGVSPRLALDATRRRPASCRGCHPRSTAPPRLARSGVGPGPPAPHRTSLRRLRPRCHAAPARLGPRPSRVRPRLPGPPVPPSATRLPQPRPPLRRSCGSGPAARPGRGRVRPGPQPPAPLRRGPPAAGLSRYVSLIFHIFTVPEIPYFTGFSARQAR